MRRLTGMSRRQVGGVLLGAAAFAVSPQAVFFAGAAPAHDITSNMTHDIEITRFHYQPSFLRIRAGDYVRWTNTDIAPHTATAKDGGWSTGTLGRDGFEIVRFTEPGTYPYTCRFHPHMTATIMVSAPA